MPRGFSSDSPVANSWFGRDCAAWLAFICSASIRSAGVPWRSPLVSFLKAYDTVMGLQAGHQVSGCIPLLYLANSLCREETW